MDLKIREALRVVFGLTVVSVILVIFNFSSPPWTTHGSAVAYYSVLAFLSVVATATALGRVRMDASPTHRLMFAGLTFLSLIHIGAALFNFLEFFPVGHVFPFGIFFNILVLTILGFFVLGSGWYNVHEAKENSFLRYRLFIPSSIIILIAIYTLGYFLVLNNPVEYLLIPLGYILGSTAIICFIVSGYLFMSKRRGHSDSDSLRLLLMNLFFVMGTFILLFILPDPSSLWVLSTTFQIAALLFAIVGISFPLLIDLGLSRKTAYGLVIAIICLTLLPFIFSHLVESLLPLVYYANVGISVLVHSGGVVFTLVMGYILYQRTRARAAWYHSPIIFLLFAWSIFEAAIVLSHLSPLYYGVGESVVPYILGGIITAITLSIAINRILSTPEKTPRVLKSLHIFGFIFMILLVAIGEYIQGRLLTIFPILESGFFGGMVLLSLAYISTFALISFIILLVAESGDKASFELVAVGSQSLWIVSLLLRVNFSVWTAGWWMAEMVVGGAITIFPFILTYFYIRDAGMVEQYESHVSVYTQLLKDDIETSHALAIDAIQKIIGTPELSDSRLESLSEALGQISHADEMARVLRLLIGDDVSEKRIFEPTNLPNSIRDAFEQLKSSNPGRFLELDLDCVTGDCSVRSDHLFSTSLYYLMDGIVQRSELVTKFKIRVVPHADLSDMWSIRIQVDMSEESLEQRKALLQRYLTTVSSGGYEFALMHRLIDLLDGKISMDTPSDVESNEIAFTIVLPTAEVKNRE
ncbi:MAG: membrane protein of unknown function [Candidatus Thorarchaeota archaeon]|nr:MAG: membrane protein of unknown function [Candidatus Thorarchaeota archaeon]